MAGPSASEVNEILRRLRRMPQHFKSVANGLTELQLRCQPVQGSWSLHELLAHLRGCADVRGGWIAKMLGEESPTIRYVSPRTGMKKTGYQDTDFVAFLGDFEHQRRDLVKTLGSLKLVAWSRSATFTGKTPGWSQSVFDVATGLAIHEEAHFQQIAETASSVAS